MKEQLLNIPLTETLPFQNLRFTSTDFLNIENFAQNEIVENFPDFKISKQITIMLTIAKFSLPVL